MKSYFICKENSDRFLLTAGRQYVIDMDTRYVDSDGDSYVTVTNDIGCIVNVRLDRFDPVDGQYLKDGQIYILEGIKQYVVGEIAAPHDEPVCWTTAGNWYRRSDGEPMTAWAGKVITRREALNRFQNDRLIFCG